MGSDLVEPDSPPPSYTEMFNEQFPFYLSVGMSYSQYWEEDATLVKFYRKAHEMKRAAKNEELWLQGLYFYEALCDVSPILHAFAKSGTKPQEYRARPIPLTREELKAEKERQAHEKRQRLKHLFSTWAESLDLPEHTEEVTEDVLRD